MGRQIKLPLFGETFCRICGKELTTEESIRKGIGPVCDKINGEVQINEISGDTAMDTTSETPEHSRGGETCLPQETGPSPAVKIPYVNKTKNIKRELIKELPAKSWKAIRKMLKKERAKCRK